MKIKIALPEDLKGYSKYEVVYILDDEIKETIEAKVENGYIVFETSHLSHYGIVAIEENNDIVNPKTNDDIVMYFISSIISLVGVTGVLIYYKKNYTGKTEKSYRFLINGYTIKMPERKTAYAEYDEQSREILLHIGPQFYLPVSLFVITKAQCQISKESYSVSQAKKEARKRLFLFLKEYERKGVVILKNNVRIDSDKNECTAKGIIKIKERVGKVQEIPSTLDGEKDIKQEPAVLNR